MFLFFFSSCLNNNEQNDKNYEQLDKEKLKEKLVTANKQYYINENEQIDGYVNRLGYKVNKTERGVRYYVYKKSSTSLLQKEQHVILDYSVKLLDGTICYTSDSTGVLDFQIGHTDLPAGLQEGLLQLGKGDKAILITPSYLGYGLSGDGGNIPSNAVLVYDVSVLNTK
jgi:FKBP-type peptidyl-prolyl cis-trans isomerase FkpA